MTFPPDPLVTSAALMAAVVVGVLMRWVIPPPRRLRSRITPYVSPRAVSRDAGALGSVFGPIIRALADRVGGQLDRSGSIALRLRQAGWYRGLDEGDAETRYRLRQLRVISLAVLVGLAASRLVGPSPQSTLAIVGLAAVVGATRTRGRLEAAIEERRQTMAIEIYTVNQLLAMRVRAGGGVVNAVKATVGRGEGEVVGELAEALRLHRAGWSGPDAFRRIAELTPEPFCARTYRLLATAEERGADLAGALLALSEDVRESRRENMKRTATKRRAAMLVPTIAILAPVLILFVAAPLPYLITSWQ